MPRNFGTALVKAGTPTSGVFQVETATAAGTVTTTGNCKVTVTAVDFEDDVVVNAAVSAGTLQVETATVVGTIGAAGAGNATVTVTATTNGLVGSPLAISVAVANDDTASQVGGKIRTELSGTTAITDKFTVGGSGATVVLTQKSPALANDATLNIAIDNDTCSGLTAAPTSANTTAGVAADGANEIALALRTALAADETITSVFTVSGADDDIVLTRHTTSTANDTTLNMAIDDDTSAGVTTAGTSTNTTAGVRGDYRGVGVGEFCIDTSGYLVYENTGTTGRPIWTAFTDTE